MPAQQRQMVFLLAIAAAIVLVIVGVLYYGGHMFYPTGVHHKHAYLAWALAVGALIVANFNRPSASVAGR
jgi:hypothetical protein